MPSPSFTKGSNDATLLLPADVLGTAVLIDPASSPLFLDSRVAAHSLSELEILAGLLMASLFLFFPLFFFVETPATETFLPKFPFLRPCNAVEVFGDEDNSDKFCVLEIRCWKILVDERANPSTCGNDDRRKNKMDEDITLMFDWFYDDGGKGK